MNRDPRVMHIGRSFGGPRHLEADCPCPKAPCGLVEHAVEECGEHHYTAMKTIRSSHWPEDCEKYQQRWKEPQE